MALAFVEPAKYTKDRRERFGYSGTKYRTEFILSLIGTRYYGRVGAVEEVVGTIEREGTHLVVFS